MGLSVDWVIATWQQLTYGEIMILLWCEAFTQCYTWVVLVHFNVCIYLEERESSYFVTHKYWANRMCIHWGKPHLCCVPMLTVCNQILTHYSHDDVQLQWGYHQASYFIREYEYIYTPGFFPKSSLGSFELYLVIFWQFSCQSNIAYSAIDHSYNWHI